MASAIGMIGENGSFSWMQVQEKRKKKTMNRVRVCCSASSVLDPYKTLRIQPGASESEVKKAFRQLALQVIFFSLNSSFFFIFDYGNSLIDWWGFRFWFISVSSGRLQRKQLWDSVSNDQWSLWCMFIFPLLSDSIINFFKIWFYFLFPIQKFKGVGT